MLVALAAYGAFLPGWAAAMGFYLRPDFFALGDALVWVRAFGQVFFSVGVGMGVMITYGSYVSRSENIPRASLVIVSADSVAAFMAGLVIFPIVFTFGGEPGAGPKLAFDTMPLVFREFPQFTGYILAIVFYLLLVIAALTSSVSLLEVARVALQEATGIGRNLALLILVTSLIVLGIPSALSYSGVKLDLLGQPFLDLMDSLVSDFALPAGVFLTVVALAWLGRRQDLMVGLPSGLVGQAWLWVVRLAAPAAILAALVGVALQ